MDVLKMVCRDVLKNLVFPEIKVFFINQTANTRRKRSHQQFKIRQIHTIFTSKTINNV